MSKIESPSTSKNLALDQLIHELEKLVHQQELQEQEKQFQEQQKALLKQRSSRKTTKRHSLLEEAKQALLYLKDLNPTSLPLGMLLNHHEYCLQYQTRLNRLWTAQLLQDYTERMKALAYKNMFRLEADKIKHEIENKLAQSRKERDMAARIKMVAKRYEETQELSVVSQQFLDSILLDAAVV